MEILVWVLITVPTTYGAILGLLHTPEIANFRKKRPSSLVSSVHTFLAKPWAVHELSYPTTQRYAKSNSTVAEGVTCTGNITTSLVDVSRAWVVDIYPSKFRVPGRYGFSIVMLLISYVLSMYSSIYFTTNSYFNSFLFAIYAIVALATAFCSFILIWGQVFRKTRIMIHAGILKIDDIDGDRTFRQTGPLLFSFEVVKEWLLGKCVYIRYENIKGPKRRLIVCPIWAAKFVLRSDPESLVLELNAVVKDIPYDPKI